MTMQLLGGAVPFPILTRAGGGGVAHTQNTVDGNDDGVALSFLAPRTGNIRQIAVALSTTTTAGDLDFRVEQPSSAGGPSGTLWATNTNIVKAIGSGDDNVWMPSGNLTASAAVTGGQLVVVVVKRTSGTLVTDIRIMSGNALQINSPTGWLSTAGSFAKGGQRPHLMIEYDTGEWLEIPGCPGYFGQSSTSFSSASNPNEVGNEFNYPFSYRLCGAWWLSDMETGHTCDLVVFDGAASPSQLAIADDFDTDFGQSPQTAHVWYGSFAPIEVPANTKRRIILRPDATSMSYIQNDWTSSTYKNGCQHGAYVKKAERITSGNPDFTTTDLSQVVLGAMIDGIDDGAAPGIFIPRRRIA